MRELYLRMFLTGSALIGAAQSYAEDVAQISADQSVTKVAQSDQIEAEEGSRVNHVQIGIGNSAFELDSVDLKGQRSLVSYNRSLSEHFRLGVFLSRSTAEISKNNANVDMEIQEIGPEARVVGSSGKLEFFGLLRMPLMGSGTVRMSNGRGNVYKGDITVSGAELATGVQLSVAPTFTLGLEMNLAMYKKVEGDVKETSASSYSAYYSNDASYKIDEELTSTAIGSNILLTATFKL